MYGTISDFCFGLAIQQNEYISIYVKNNIKTLKNWMFTIIIPVFENISLRFPELISVIFISWYDFLYITSVNGCVYYYYHINCLFGILFW